MPATLTSLRVRNLALVEDLLFEPQAGFTVLTGETGAGKSVLLGALHLLLGERADRQLIRSGAEACTVEAVFENASTLDPWLEEAGMEPTEEGRLLLKRTFATVGAARQFINGSPATLTALRELGVRLVDLHGPHDHQSLFSREQQTLLLDSFAKAEGLRQQFASARSLALALQREMEETITGEQGALREMDLLEHQVREIEAARLRPGEEEELVELHRSAANAARIRELLATLRAITDGTEGALADRAAEAIRTSRELLRLDPSSTRLHEAAEAVAAAATDLSSELGRYRFEEDPAVLAAAEARLDLLGSLKRKYGPDIAAILAFGQEAAQRLAALRARMERAGTLEAEVAAAEQNMKQAAAALSEARALAARQLERDVIAGLRELGFRQCGFEVTLPAQETPGPLGSELADFVFAPNPGEPPRPLRAIASSGEISRVMLALKGALAEQDAIPLLVFDEIDANVGGEIAGRVAARMRKLAESRQVLCITHLPQVAAAATHHYLVRKEVVGDRTRTLLEHCRDAAREREIARMLGGQTATALAHARELLAG